MVFNLTADTANKAYFDGLENHGYGDVIQNDIKSIMSEAKEINYAFEDDEPKAKCADYVEKHKDELLDAGFKVRIDSFGVTISWA